MDVTCQFSLYPLGVEDLGPPIERAVAAVRARGLQVEVGQMSSEMSGTAALVFSALGEAFTAAATGGCVLVATVSNACPA